MPSMSPSTSTMAPVNNPPTPPHSQEEQYNLHFLGKMIGRQNASMDGSPTLTNQLASSNILGHATPHYSPRPSEELMGSPIGYQTEDSLEYHAPLAGSPSDYGVDDASLVGGDFHPQTNGTFLPQHMQSAYPQQPPPQQQYFYDGYRQVPTTPVSITESQARRHRSVARSPALSSTSARVSKKKPKKATVSKPNKAAVPKLDKPLSVLTAEYHDIPVKDMGVWVNRSTEERLQESAKRDGYITRPMNSFMLYRSAYAERTKQWCSENNHQVVSAVCGQSWPLEPESIKKKYEEYAKIERENHQIAHPGYKFSPTKAQANRKKKATKKIDAEDASEMEDDMMSIDGDESRKRGSGRRSRPTSANYALALPPHENIGSPNQYTNSPASYDGGASKSSFQATNPGRAAPLGHEQHPTTGYMATIVQTENGGLGAGVIENVSIRRTQGPARAELLNEEMAYGTYTTDGSGMFYQPGPYQQGYEPQQTFDNQGRSYGYEMQVPYTSSTPYTQQNFTGHYARGQWDNTGFQMQQGAQFMSAGAGF